MPWTGLAPVGRQQGNRVPLHCLPAAGHRRGPAPAAHQEQGGSVLTSCDRRCVGRGDLAVKPAPPSFPSAPGSEGPLRAKKGPSPSACFIWFLAPADVSRVLPPLRRAGRHVASPKCSNSQPRSGAQFAPTDESVIFATTTTITTPVPQLQVNVSLGRRFVFFFFFSFFFSVFVETQIFAAPTQTSVCGAWSSLWHGSELANLCCTTPAACQWLAFNEWTAVLHSPASALLRCSPCLPARLLACPPVRQSARLSLAALSVRAVHSSQGPPCLACFHVSTCPAGPLRCNGMAGCHGSVTVQTPRWVLRTTHTHAHANGHDAATVDQPEGRRSPSSDRLLGGGVWGDLGKCVRCEEPRTGEQGVSLGESARVRGCEGVGLRT